MKFIFPLVVSSIIIFSSCSRKDNYNKAVIEQKSGKLFLKLKGRRHLMSHDLISAIFPKTYVDSTYLDITSIRNGFLKGDSIPVSPGNYKMSGKININHDKIIVALSYVNTDDHREDSLSWNGSYELNDSKHLVHMFESE